MAAAVEGVTVRAGEVFPDLHHKMSKKIAQLTKVIYHLNTKNEDRQFELEEVKANHQREMQEILTDASNKIQRFKESLEARRAEANAAAQAAKITEKYEAEKREALGEFKAFQRSSQQREKAIGQECKSRMENVIKEVDDERRRFAQSLAHFTERGQAMAAALAAARAGSEASNSALADRHSSELAAAVRESNMKYNAMLTEQMMAQDTLRNKLEREGEENVSNAIAITERAADQRIGRMRAEINAEKEIALMAAKRETDEAIKSLRSESAAAAEKARLFAERSAAELRKLKAENDALSERSSRTFLEASEKLSACEKELAASRKEIDRLREQRTQVASRAGQAEETAAALEKLTEDRALEVQKLKNELEVTNIKLETERENHKKTRQELADAVQRHNAYTAAMSDEMSQRDAQMASRLGEIASLRQNLEVITKAAEEARDRSAKELSSEKKSAERSRLSYASDLAKVQALLDQARQSGSDTQTGLQSEVGRLRKLVEDMEIAAKVSASESEERFSSLAQESEKSLAVQKQELERLHETALRASEKLSQDRISEMESNHANEIQRLLKEAQDAEVRHGAALASLQATLQQQLDELNSKLTEKDRLAGDHISKASERSAELEERSRNLEKDLAKAQSKLAEEQSRLSMTQQRERALASDLESLRQQLLAAGRSSAETLERANTHWKLTLSTQETEWREKLQAAVLQGEKMVNEANTVAESKLEEYMREASLGAEEAQRTQNSALMSSAQEKLDSAVAAAVTAAERSFAELSAAAAERSAEELSALRRSHETALTSELSRNGAKHELALKDALQKLNKDWTLKIDMLKDSHATLLSVKIRELNDAHRIVLEKQKQEMELANRKASEEAARLAASAATKYTEEIERERAATAAANAETITVRTDLTRLLANTQAKLQEEKDTLSHALKQAQEQAVMSMKTATLQWANEKNMLENDAREMGEKHAKAVLALELECTRLEDKYATRPSRESDVALISRLEAEAVERNALVRRTLDEMAYFKRELLNREEMYNQKFNASPVVGIMQVARTKDVITGAKPPRVSRSNSMSSGAGGGASSGTTQNGSGRPIQRTSSFNNQTSARSGSNPSSSASTGLRR